MKNSEIGFVNKEDTEQEKEKYEYQVNTNNPQLIEQFVRDRILLYLLKNKDYNDSFTNTLNKYGEIAFIVRAEDKIARFNNLLAQQAVVKNEDISDTVKDLFNYTCMFKLWKERKYELEELIAIMKQFAMDNFNKFFKYLEQLGLEWFNQEQMKYILTRECS